MNNRKTPIIILLFGAMLSTGCNNSKDGSEQNISDSNSAVVTAPSTTAEPFTADESAVFKFDMVLANLPSPLEILNDLNKAKLSYEPSVLLDSKMHQPAASTQLKALFIGAYSIDLGYSINYDQSQIAIIMGDIK